MSFLLLLALGCSAPDFTVPPLTPPIVAPVVPAVQPTQHELKITIAAPSSFKLDVPQVQVAPVSVEPLKVEPVAIAPVKVAPVEVNVTGHRWPIAGEPIAKKDDQFSPWVRCVVLKLDGRKCPPCKRLEDNVLKRLPDDWRYGRGEKDHVRPIDVEEHEDDVKRFLRLPAAPSLDSIATPFLAVIEDGRVVRTHAGTSRSDGRGDITPSALTWWITKGVWEKPAGAEAGGDPSAPTPIAEIQRVLGILPKPQKALVDLGCGPRADVVIEAGRKGWRAIGIEINPAAAAAAKERVLAEGLESRVTIIEGDATKIDVSQIADVFWVYLYSDTLEKLVPMLRGFRAGASYLHQPPGLPVSKSGDSYFYCRDAAQQYQQPARAAVWGGQQYSGPVCNNPGCAMCQSIRRQLGR